MPAMRTACVLSIAASLVAAPLPAAAAPAGEDPSELRAPPPPMAVAAPEDAKTPPVAPDETSTTAAAKAPEAPAGTEPTAPAPDEATAKPGSNAAAASEGTFSAEAESAPARMRPLQRAGWWSVAGAAVLGTVAGVLSSLARGQEDRLNTIAGQVDPETFQFPTYADVQSDYEDALRKGRRYATGAQVVAGIAAAALATGLVLMFVDARRQNKRARADRRRARRHNGRRRRARLRGLRLSF